MKEDPVFLDPPYVRKSASRQIVSLILDGMRSGKYRVGQRLAPESHLLQQWKISPASLRDAFKELETLGLLSRKPRTGTVIQQFEPSFLFERCALLLNHRPDLRKDLEQMRQVVEDALVPLVGRKAQAVDWKSMEKAVRDMAAATNAKELAKHDLEFHQAYYRATHNAFFAAMIPLLAGYFSMEELVSEKNFSRERSRQAERHSRLLQALKAKDIRKARRYTNIWPRPLPPSGDSP